MTTSHLLPLLADTTGVLSLAPADFQAIPSALRIALLLVLILCNAVFVAAEISLTRIHESQLESAAAEKRKGAALGLHVSRHLETYLAASQLGITFSSIMLGALGEPFLSVWLIPLLAPLGLGELAVRVLAFFLGVAVLTVFHMIIGEQIPRAIGIRKTIGTAIACSYPVRFFHVLVSPAVWLVDKISNGILRLFLRIEPVDSNHLGHTADELRIMVEETRRAHEVTETEQEILKNALQLNELCVRDVLTPRNDVVMLDVHKTFRENLDTALESKHTRFPLVDGHLDKTLGLIHIKDLLREMHRETLNLFAAKRDLIRVSEMLPLDEMLQLFLSKRAHIALVVDEFGGSVGLVMLDDVLDQVVGEIFDEFDDEEEVGFHRIGTDEFVVEGWLPLHELAHEVSDINLEDPDVSTIGGYVTNLAGRIPELGETFEVNDYRAEILQADERTVGRIRFSRQESGEPGVGGRGEESVDELVASPSRESR